MEDSNMTRTHAYQMTAAACCLAVLLAGCATTNGPVPMPQAPAPVETPDVKTVKAMVLPIDDTVTVAEAFAQYGSGKRSKTATCSSAALLTTARSFSSISARATTKSSRSPW